MRETSAPPLGQYHAADVYSNGYAGRVPAELDFHNVNYNDRQLNLITQRMNNMNFEQYLQATENGPPAVDSSDKRIHLRYDGKLIWSTLKTQRIRFFSFLALPNWFYFFRRS